MNSRSTIRPQAGDEGFTLIEVLVALLVFAILSTGIVAGATTIIRMTAENRARITAANLASQDLDVVRAVADPFSIDSIPASKPEDIPVDGRTYHLSRSVSWLSASGADVSCNSATNLFLLRVNTTVTWDGELGTTPAVRDDTILAPTSGATNSDKGAIAVSVSDLGGDPVSGVAVSVTPTTGGGGAALTSQPKGTTAGGCTYANDVTPGSYSVTVSKPGYLGDSQSSSTSKDVTVTAGATQSVAFTADQAATFITNYTTGPVKYSGTVWLPSNLPTNFINSGTIYTTTAPGASVKLYPFSSGYSVVTGPMTSNTANCASVDPQAWPSGLLIASGVRASGAAAPGGTTTLNIPMGVVVVTAPAGATLTATQATPAGLGNPGCAVTGTTLQWSHTATGGTDALQLPYGSWTIKANGRALTFLQQTIPTNAVLGGVSLDGTVTLDPRKL